MPELIDDLCLLIIEPVSLACRLSQHIRTNKEMQLPTQGERLTLENGQPFLPEQSASLSAKTNRCCLQLPKRLSATPPLLHRIVHC